MITCIIILFNMKKKEGKPVGIDSQAGKNPHDNIVALYYHTSIKPHSSTAELSKEAFSFS
jgi:hypothetical protein